MATDERRPDTVTFTFETTVDVVVDLRTGEVKLEEGTGELADDWHYVALFAEGEFAGEAQAPGGHVNPYDADFEEGDQELVDRAEALMDAAFEAGTIVKSTTPEEIA